MLMINKTKCPQIMKGRSIFKVIIEPGAVFDSSQFPNLLPEFFEPFSFEKFHNAEIVSFHRRFALGDLIMLIPVMRQFKEFYNVGTIQLFTLSQYVNVLKGLFPDIKIFTEEYITSSIKHGILYELDSLLEKDHSITNQEAQKHRMYIYGDVFGLPKLKKYNWDVNRMPQDKIKIRTKRKTIGLQIKGSGVMKTLPRPVVDDLITFLSENYHVVLIDHEKLIFKDMPEVTNTCGRLTVGECITMMSDLDACITMDSGALWMAHLAKCPVVCLLGPTREEERVSLHPLYPDQATSVSISDLIGCEACFETKVHCKGKINCMRNFDKTQLFVEILKKIKFILGEV